MYVAPAAAAVGQAGEVGGWRLQNASARGAAGQRLGRDGRRNWDNCHHGKEGESKCSERAPYERAALWVFHRT